MASNFIKGTVDLDDIFLLRSETVLGAGTTGAYISGGTHLNQKYVHYSEVGLGGPSYSQPTNFIVGSTDLDSSYVRKNQVYRMNCAYLTAAGKATYDFGNYLYTWGVEPYSYYGQSGLGLDVQTTVPTRVNTTNNWASISAYRNHMVARTSDNSLWTWGRGSEGQLGDGLYTTRGTPGYVGGALLVSAGGYFTVVIGTDSNLYVTGNVAGGGGANFAATGGPWKDACAGRWHYMAIKTDNTLYGRGTNVNGQLGDNTRVSAVNFVAIAGGGSWKTVSCGTDTSHGIKTDGTLWAWGNGRAALGLNSTIDRSAPVQIGSGNYWSILSESDNHCMALTTSGDLYVWGSNTDGELGTGNNTSYSYPVNVYSDTTWSVISAGAGHSAGVKTNGTLWVWGYSSFHQGWINNPTQLGTDSNWKFVALSRMNDAGHYCAAIKGYNC